MEKAYHFFLGANTSCGFVSRFDQLAQPGRGERLFLVKGGPGTGKSTLIRSVGEALQEFDETIEWIHCSSDVDSLDGFILPKCKIAMADATPPHALEPRLPGAFEQPVNLCDCWDSRMLFDKSPQIGALSEKISRCHEHCCRFLAAAAGLQKDSYRIALEACDAAKIGALAQRMAQKLLTPQKRGTGQEKIRFLSAVTNKGPVQFHETTTALCDRLYAIEDHYGPVSRLLLTALRSQALERGYDVISCYCPLLPFDRLEHLFVPELSLGFSVSNNYHEIPFTPEKVIRSRRFLDQKVLSRYKKRLQFQRKAAQQLISSAAALLAEAKAFHDDLERYYISAMDFGQVENVKQRLVKDLQSFLSEAF